MSCDACFFDPMTRVNLPDDLSLRSKAMMEFAAETLLLLHYNDYAYKHGVISEQMYRRMD